MIHTNFANQGDHPKQTNKWVSNTQTNQQSKGDTTTTIQQTKQLSNCHKSAFQPQFQDTPFHGRGQENE